MNDKLKFQFGNAKLMRRIATMNLPAGYACPHAVKCLAKFNPSTRKIEDGKKAEFRCFGAMEERYPSVGDGRWYNFDLLKKARTLSNMIDLITESMPASDYVRPHSSAGDFYNRTYFLAWLNVAINNPDTFFYTYTKSVKFIVEFKNQFPDNMNIVASYGGTDNDLIEKHNLQYAKVFNTVAEATAAGLEVDFDDSHAFAGKTSFALIVHGSQAKGTIQAKAAHANIKVKEAWKNKTAPKKVSKIHVK